MEDWQTYHGIKKQVFRDMYEARRSILLDKREWSSQLEDVYVAYDDQGRGKDESLPDLYHLMENTIFLILATNQDNPTSQAYSRNEVQSILDKTPLEELLADVPEDEARELRIDLEILGFIPATRLTLPMVDWSEEDIRSWENEGHTYMRYQPPADST
jgi:hypothetical protein